MRGSLDFNCGVAPPWRGPLKQLRGHPPVGIQFKTGGSRHGGGFLFGRSPNTLQTAVVLTLFIPPPMETGGGVVPNLLPFLSGAPPGRDRAGRGPPPFPAAADFFFRSSFFRAPPAEAAFRLIPARDDGGVDQGGTAAPEALGEARASPSSPARHAFARRLAPAPLPAPSRAAPAFLHAGPPPPVALLPPGRLLSKGGRKGGLASFYGRIWPGPKKSLFYNRALFFTFLWAAVAGQCRTMAINPEEFFSFFF